MFVLKDRTVRPVSVESQRSEPRSNSTLTTVLVIIVAIVALYFGRDLFIPFALAILLSFALSPLAVRLRRLGIGRVPSVLCAVLVAFVIIGGVGILVGGQLVQLAANLPGYHQNIVQKVQSIRINGPEDGALERVSTMVRELQSEIAEVAMQQPEPNTPQPIPVEIQQPPPTPFEVIENVAVPLLSPIVTAGLVIVFLIFMLLERESLRERFIALVGTAELHVTTEALDEAARRVSRYLLMQLLVNASYGIPIGIGLWFIGVPNALLWGVLATVLRFIPYVGPFIAALFPIALAVAVDPGWTMVLWVMGLFVGAELISNNVVEPWLYGASTGVSAFAIIMAAIFWTTLWGPAGLFLSTPLTVCLAVMGRYVPQLRFFSVLLGSAPALAPEARLYQRMLAGDPYEGEEIAHEYLRDRPLIAFYDELALPALRLAERDRQRSVLTPERQGVVVETFLRLVAELADHEDKRDPESDDKNSIQPSRAAPDDESGPAAVLCVGARTGLDLACAGMLVHLLQRRGISARALPSEALSPEGIASLRPEAIEAICVSYLGANAAVHAPVLVRRLRRRAAAAKIIVGFWNAPSSNPGRELAADIGADALAMTFAQSVSEIERRLEVVDDPMLPAPIPADEPERLAELARLDGLDPKPDAAFDAITQKLAKTLNVPIALVSLVSADRQLWKGATGLPDDLAAAGSSSRETSVCGHVVAAKKMLVIKDVRRDKRFSNNPFLRQRGIRFYAGAPLLTRNGHVVGTLCVIDTRPRELSKSESALLQLLADQVVVELEARSAPAVGTQGDHAPELICPVAASVPS